MMPFSLWMMLILRSFIPPLYWKVWSKRVSNYCNGISKQILFYVAMRIISFSTARKDL